MSIYQNNLNEGKVFNSNPSVIVMGLDGRLSFNVVSKFPQLSEEDEQSIYEAIQVTNDKYNNLSRTIIGLEEKMKKVMSGKFLRSLSKTLMKANTFGEKAQKFKKNLRKTRQMTAVVRNELYVIMLDNVKMLLDDSLVKKLESIEKHQGARIMTDVDNNSRIQSYLQNPQFQFSRNRSEAYDSNYVDEYSRGCTDEF